MLHESVENIALAKFANFVRVQIAAIFEPMQMQIVYWFSMRIVHYLKSLL